MQVKHNNELIIDNIPFAKKLAAQFHSKRPNLGFDLEDYEGAALLGLCDAARRFEPERGMLFRTYAYFRIRGAMWDLLRESGGVQRRQFNKIVKNQTQLASADEFCAEGVGVVGQDSESTPKDINDKLPYTFARSVRELANLMHIIDDVNMLVHVGGDGEAELTYSNDRNPEQTASLKSTRQFVKRLIKQLPERQQRILELRYFEGQSFDTISEDLGGISKSWVSRMHTTALDKLRELVHHELNEKINLEGQREITPSISELL